MNIGGRLKSTKLEAIARALTVFTFVLLCWVAHRALQIRETCVSSSFVAYVLMDGAKANNCTFESRLNLRTLTAPMDRTQIQELRALEVLEPLSPWLGAPAPTLTIELSTKDPNAFEMAPRALRLGVNWLEDKVQVRRALIMTVLKSRSEYNQFQLEVMSDFLLLALYSDNVIQGNHSLRRDVKFPTAAPSLEQYCLSPFRSLAHKTMCQLPGAESADPHSAVWGFRPLLATALWRAFGKLPLEEQIRVLERVREMPDLPQVAAVQTGDVANLVMWFNTSFDDYARSLSITNSEEGRQAQKVALKELEVEAPTHWELTVDVTKTPAWKEIVEQLKKRSRFRSKERALVFTPEGEVALPSGLKVAWNVEDIQSQKHVMIACQWPSASEAVHVQARQIFAKKTCDKLSGAFWD